MPDRRPNPLRTLKPRLVEGLREGFHRGLVRVSGGRSVVVTEYPTDAKARWGWEDRPPNRHLARALEPSLPVMRDERDALEAHRAWFETIPVHAPDGGLQWDNEYWSGLDAGVQLRNLIDRRPATYLEVGSGYSTLLARRAIADHGLDTRIVSIDPAPRAEVDAACDVLLRAPLEQAGLSVFEELAAGDVVLIDGSHLAFMNADSVIALLEVLPSLPAGVLVGIDDVFLPCDYPPTWEARWYAEQYVLAGYLLGGASGCRVRMASWYLTQVVDGGEPHPLDKVLPGLGSSGKSVWLDRT